MRFGAVKIFTDGSLGAWTAALKEPYFDKNDTKGGFFIEEEVLKETVGQAVENGWQTAIHGIGDEAIELFRTDNARFMPNKGTSTTGGNNEGSNSGYVDELRAQMLRD